MAHKASKGKYRVTQTRHWVYSTTLTTPPVHWGRFRPYNTGENEESEQGAESGL